MTCREFVDFLMAYLEGELPASQRDAFDAHMRVCVSCVHYLEGYRETVRLGRAVCLGDRIEILNDALVVDRKGGAEERQDGLAGGGRKPTDEGFEIDDRHGSPWAGAGGEGCHLSPSSNRTPAHRPRGVIPTRLCAFFFRIGFACASNLPKPHPSRS